MGNAYAPVVEPFVVQDTYVTALHDVEHVGEGAYRFTFVVAQKSIYNGEDENVVVARLIMHPKAIIQGSMWALRAVGARCGKWCSLIPMH